MIDPGTQEDGEDYMAYNRRRWGGDGWTHSLRAKGRQVGAPFEDWRIWPNTMKAHQLMRFAPEKAPELKHRIFEGIYERGENVSDLETLCRIAADCGVDADGFRKVVDTRPAIDDIRRECAKASQRGVSGVPYFVVSGREGKRPVGFSGAQSTEVFLEVFSEVS
mmetsp:Transcript_6182/g.18281  ORF Transcript_6182/g.18281 Transcript_6182/m.18281 type:complete len:164 (+) Transcript_6182:1656-2147(+)